MLFILAGGSRVTISITVTNDKPSYLNRISLLAFQVLLSWVTDKLA